MTFSTLLTPCNQVYVSVNEVLGDAETPPIPGHHVQGDLQKAVENESSRISLFRGGKKKFEIHHSLFSIDTLCGLFQDISFTWILKIPAPK